MWLRREEIEDHELRSLVTGATHSRGAYASRRREESPDPLRTAFQRDRDRIIHCTAFRRLQHKTQVFAAFEGDHFRTRLTHSLEVSQMARGAARALRLNADLAEAVALGHDLGHPPFGHVGERALDELMDGKGGFRHNAHGARIVDYLEDRNGDGLGLNLTLAVRRSLLKGRIPNGFPIAEDLAETVAEPAAAPAPLEARVVDLCDRIAYLAHDLDDGLRAGVLTLDQVDELRIWRCARDACGSQRKSKIVSEMISLMIHDLVQSSAKRLESADKKGVAHGSEMAVMAHEVLEFLGEQFYNSRRVLAVMDHGQERIRAAFAHFVAHPDELPTATRMRMDTDGVERVVCDYVAGMTDRYLIRQSP